MNYLMGRYKISLVIINIFLRNRTTIYQYAKKSRHDPKILLKKQ